MSVYGVLPRWHLLSITISVSLLSTHTLCPFLSQVKEVNDKTLIGFDVVWQSFLSQTTSTHLVPVEESPS